MHTLFLVLVQFQQLDPIFRREHTPEHHHKHRRERETPFFPCKNASPVHLLALGSGEPQAVSGSGHRHFEQKLNFACMCPQNEMLLSLEPVLRLFELSLLYFHCLVAQKMREIENKSKKKTSSFLFVLIYLRFFGAEEMGK